MSEERGDSTYKPNWQRPSSRPAYKARRPIRPTRSDKDYSEVLRISDTKDNTEGAVELGTGDLFVKEETDSLETWSTTSEQWTPHTFSARTENLIRGITEFREQAALFLMAKSPETSMAEVLQLMMKMRADDKR